LKILILKPSSLGDIVQALPVIRLLRAQWPDSQIAWWVDSRFSAILHGDPDINAIYLFDRQKSASPSHWPSLIHNVDRLRAERFDLVIDLQGLARSAVFGWFVNGSTYVGVDDRREKIHGLYDIAVSRPQAPHAVDWYLEVLNAIGVPTRRKFEWLPLKPAGKLAVDERMKGRRYVCLIPGARWDNKRWPVSGFSQLAKGLSKDFHDLWFVVLGGKSDVPLGLEIQEALPSRVLNLTGQTTLPELVEFLRGSELVVSDDTGPMHIADAVGVPLVAIFGPTDPQRTGPYQQRENVVRISLPCSPCLKDRCHWIRPLECLTGIDSERVLSMARSVMRK